MAYTALDATKPTTAQTRQAIVDSTRTNLDALRDAIAALGAVQGFAYYPTGGTAEQPTTIYFKRGSECVKVVLTWGSSGGSDGNVTKAAYYFAANETHASFPTSTNGTYDAMADASGDYVMTIGYDTNGNATSATWGAVP